MVMNLVNLRLKTSLSFVKKCKAMADIGSDHGYASIYAVQTGIAEKVIATDISRPSLDKTERLVEKYGLGDKIECRCGDGLKILSPGDADVMFAAGMGAELLADIVLQSEETSKGFSQMILQPMNNAEPLRRRLSEAGFSVYDRAIVIENGKYYQTLEVVYGNAKELSDIEYELGTFVFREKIPFASEYIAYMIKHYENIKKYIGENDSDQACRILKEADEKTARYREALLWANAE